MGRHCTCFDGGGGSSAINYRAEKEPVLEQQDKGWHLEAVNTTQFELKHDMRRTMSPLQVAEAR